MATFDWNKAVLEKFLFEDGDVTKLSEFIKEQAKLHSLNKISGQVFNPLGFALNISDLSDNPVAEQTLRKVVSDITGNSGLLDTEDGQTIGRVLDNNANEVYFRDVKKFKESAERRTGSSFVSSSLRNIANSLLNKVDQALPVDFDLSASKSIMAQALAYSEDLVQENFFKGTQTKFEGLYKNENAVDSENISIQPLGTNALGYTHSLYSLTNLDPVKLRRLISDVKNGFYAQNILVRKPEFVKDYEEIQRIKQRSEQVVNRDFWVRRTAEYTPATRSQNTFESSGTRKVIEADKKLADYILKEMGKYPSIKKESTNPLFDLVGLMINDFSEYIEYSGRIWNQENRNFSSSTNSQIPTEEISKKYFEKRQEAGKNNNDSDSLNPNKINDGFSNLININFSQNRQTFISDREKLHDSDFNDLINLSDDSNDPIMISSITEGEDEDLEKYLFLSIQDIRTEQTIYLKPYIDTITDDTQASFDEGEYLGRTESIPKYRKTVGSVNFSFILHASTPKELMTMYKKLDFIDSLNFPIADEEYISIKNPIIRFSLGDLYRNRGGYITSFSKVITSGESNWETRSGITVPKMINCSISIQKFHDSMPFIPKNYNFDRSGHTLFDMNYTKYLEDD